jgi:hypothetical protein
MKNLPDVKIKNSKALVVTESKKMQNSDNKFLDRV